MTNRDAIASFYAAFQRRDGPAMGALYAATARFEDPVFTLSGWEVPAMWRMLCERATDLRVEFTDLRAEGTTGSAHWEAWYTFSATGRPVHNVIDASFVFRDGRVILHRDHFDFHAWSSQALGWPGKWLGWTPFLHQAVRRRSARALQSYAARAGLGEGKGR